MSLLRNLRTRIKWKLTTSVSNDGDRLNNIHRVLMFGDDVSVDSYRAQGLVVVKGVLSQSEVDDYIANIENNLVRDEYKQKYASNEYWMGNVAEVPNLSTIVYHEKIETNP